jgi:glycolate oxidase FAD binding subunit
MGTLGLLLEVSIKVLPRTAASATVKTQMEQSEAIKLMNLLASQPWPLNASAWVDGVLYLRLSGAKAAVQSAISSFAKTHHMQTMDDGEANNFWLSLREQTHPWFQGASEQSLWRVALPSTTDVLKASNQTLIEWHGGQRWVKGYETPSEIKELKSLAQSLGGHAKVFRSKNKSEAMLSSLKDHPLTAPLAMVEERLRKTFDPQGVFATGRLI